MCGGGSEPSACCTLATKSMDRDTLVCPARTTECHVLHTLVGNPQRRRIALLACHFLLHAVLPHQSTSVGSREVPRAASCLVVDALFCSATSLQSLCKAVALVLVSAHACAATCGRSHLHGALVMRTVRWLRSLLRGGWRLLDAPHTREVMRRVALSCC